MIMLTDAEIAFADSPEGRAKIAHARMTHELRDAGKDEPWTDAHQSRAARDAAAEKARGDLAAASFNAGSALADAATVATVARAEMIGGLHNPKPRPTGD